jgi:ADP-ribose pyrophosphatase
MSLPHIALPEVKKSEIAHKGYFTLRIDSLELPHGIRRPYSVLETGCHAAAVIAETTDGKILVLKEYRHPTGKWIYGCAGGRIDTGESPIEAAKRELLEETGYTAEEFITLGSAFPFPAVADQNIHYVLARGAKYLKAPTPEPFELITPCLLSEEDLEKALQSGDPVDGVLCTALYFRSIFKK